MKIRRWFYFEGFFWYEIPGGGMVQEGSTVSRCSKIDRRSEILNYSTVFNSTVVNSAVSASEVTNSEVRTSYVIESIIDCSYVVRSSISESRVIENSRIVSSIVISNSDVEGSKLYDSAVAYCTRSAALHVYNIPLMNKNIIYPKYHNVVRVSTIAPSKHVLYTIYDFTKEEIARRNKVAVAATEHGVLACKQCGAGGIELTQYKTCELFGRRNDFIGFSGLLTPENPSTDHFSVHFQK